MGDGVLRDAESSRSSRVQLGKHRQTSQEDQEGFAKNKFLGNLPRRQGRAVGYAFGKALRLSGVQNSLGLSWRNSGPLFALARKQADTLSPVC